MTQQYPHCAQALKPILWLGAALLILISTSTWAQPINDVKKWLKEFKGQLKQTDNAPVFTEVEQQRFYLQNDTTSVNIDTKEVPPARASINDDNFEVEYRKVVRANRERIRKMLNRAVEINLINTRSQNRRHRVYFNTVEQQLESRHRIGAIKLNLLLADQQSEIKLKYRFH